VLRLLLDEHLPRALAEQLRSQRPGLEAFLLADWESGTLLGASDFDLLAEALNQELTLVTYDQRTIAPLLKEWGETGTSHGGVIFVNHRTLVPTDIGGLLRALLCLWDEQGRLCWRDRCCRLYFKAPFG